MFSKISLEQNWGADFEAKWLLGIESHLASAMSETAPYPLETLYLGGGTPGLLSEQGLREFYRILSQRFLLPSEMEWTIECNPENITRDKLNLFKSVGINRLSMGVQSFRSESLKRLERLATEPKIFEAIDLIQKSFSNWSLDLMMAVPEQGLKELESELQILQRINPPHFSAYLLSIDDNHKWHHSPKIKNLLPDSETQVEYFKFVDSWSVENGYDHYELSNYAKPGFKSRHNSIYWNSEKTFFAVGPGAHGFVRQKNQSTRFEMIRDPKEWQKSSHGISWIENLSAEQQEIEELYFDLRVRRPMNRKKWDSVLQSASVSECFDANPAGFQLKRSHWPLMDHIAEKLVHFCGA